ncbi:MAG: hypothetical protein ABI175_05940 [Polyangiales bacterium]
MFARRALALVSPILLAVGAAGCATALEEGLTSGPGRDGAIDGAGEHDGDITTKDSSTPGLDASGIDTRPSDASGTDTSTVDSAVGDGVATDTATVDSSVADTAVPDTAVPDTSVPDTSVPDTSPPVTTVTFPTATSTTYGLYTGTGTLGTGGSSAAHWPSGEYVEQLYSVPGPVTKLDLDITMYDGTAGCAIGRSNSFAVKLNGTVVGSFSWVSTGGGATKTISQKYTFAAVPTSSGAITIRVESTSSVCSGGSNWNWNPGGTATMR